ncbi:uncharacterized protein K02A2.6-like [Helicoverpa armigera]|uniref:uncharacterized protein K02A2.6-like n=1 Tax=Helicoverpa armigera TaxID=29058 RepID=UPI0030828712
MSVAQITLEKFECAGDTTSVAIRWEKWKRSLQIYLLAAGIVDDQKQTASLLHFGGPELQEIFFSIPENSDSGSSGTTFKTAVKKLDNYFAPKQSKVYERHVFRLLKQEPQEKFEKFLVRLRQQAAKCDLDLNDEYIIDQIAEKCSSNDLRKKILKLGDAITLDVIIKEANILEVLGRQLGEYVDKTPDSQGVNRIQSRFKNMKYCRRCGRGEHTKQGRDCPAKNKRCLECGEMGHFRAQCLNIKRKIEHNGKGKEESIKGGKSNQIKRFKRIYNVRDKDDDRPCQPTDYIFNISSSTSITGNIGGVNVQMIIDSGCNDNLITDKTWKTMKESNVVVTNQDAHPVKNFMAYGSDSPLKLLGSFQANIQVGERTENSKFYVIKDGTCNLLGRLTATSLGILRIEVDVNAIVYQEFPKFKDVLITIPIDSTIPAVSQPYRRIPIPLEEKVNKKIEELLAKDIIEEVKSASNWVSPIVPILKDNGEVRLCVDMRQANLAIRRENHPLPTMDQILPRVRFAKVFSKLDIKDAFHHIEIHPDSRDITTFISNRGLFRYKRMMFGINCAPEIFQKTLERILIGCEGVVNFIDDILIFARNLQEHDERLKRVMEVLDKHKVLLRKDKCIYRVNKIQFLGHELTDQGVKPLQKYSAAISEFRPPTNVAELQSFLGLINYVGKWIPNLGEETEPLRILLKNRTGRNSDIKEAWGEAQQIAFNNLKAALVNVPHLGYYDPDDKTAVLADASPVALGAVLVQIDNGGPRIIAFGSKTLSHCERRYCQTEKEALALVWAVEHFDMFLYGKEFDLITDHKPLEVIFGPRSKPCARIERWVLRLQSYKFKIKYVPGKNNIADPLSRLCKLEETPAALDGNQIRFIVEHTVPCAVPLRDLIEQSRKDPEIHKVREGLYKDIWDETVKKYKTFQTELCFHEDILLRGTRIVIPGNLRDRVLQLAHEGHPGIVGMKARLRTKVWWPNLDKDATNACKSCKGCTLVSAPNPPNPLKRRELPSEPWVDIALDLMGPLPSNIYILVVVDYYTRYKEVKLCRSVTSAEIIEQLKDIFSRLGNPVSLTSDNGKQFTSEEFKTFCAERDIRIFNTVPYSPQQNGEVERQNRSILKRLKIAQAEKKNLKEALRTYLEMYNSTPHTVTGKTPAELFFRRQFRDKLPMINDMTYKPEDFEIRDRDKEHKEKGKEYADRKRRATDSDLSVGDKVYLKNTNKTNKLSLDFDPTIHTVESVNGNDVQLKNDETGQQTRRNVIHLKKAEGQWQVVDKSNVDNCSDQDDMELSE